MSETKLPSTSLSQVPSARLAEVLDAAMDRPAPDRVHVIDEMCAGDEGLREQAHSLLRALMAAGHLLEPSLPAPKPLTGLTIGPYQVGERVGAGGMGVVYRATDTRLNRTVAIKSLPASVAGDPQRRARLEREARILAGLNHPNIAAIYDIEPGQTGSHGPLLVLEHVQGLTLAERLAQSPGGLPGDEVRAICGQLLQALEAAHNAGVVHRDIKPANVMLGADGSVKVLDFGVARDLALVTDGSGSGTPQATFPSGTLAGTAAYMSPEQARAKPTDKRTDLWAFGCVLFEMLRGTRAFDGETVSDTIASVLRAEPDWAALPGSTPQGVVTVLRRCLEKDPQKRMRDAGDARLELEAAWEEGNSGAAEQGGASRRGSSTRRPLLIGAVAFIGGAAVALAVLSKSGWSAPKPAGAPVRMTIDLPEDTPLRADAYGGCVAFSPDGRSLLFSAGPALGAGPQLYLRRLDSFENKPIPGTFHGFTPFFSPDGRSAGFCDLRIDGGSWVKRTSIDGGVAQMVAELPEGGCGCCWCEDGSIICSSGFLHTLVRVGPDGGTPEPITTVPEGSKEVHVLPSLLPGGRSILFTRHCLTKDGYADTLEALDLTTGRRQVVLNEASMGQFVPPNLVFFRQGGSVMAVPIDLKSLRPLGDARTVATSPVAHAPDLQFTVSQGGDLAYVVMPDVGFGGELAWFERRGPGLAAKVTPIYEGREPIYTLRASPDGKLIAFTAGVPQIALWVHDTERATTARIASGPAEFPVWTPDGKSIIFTTTVEGSRNIVIVPADGSASPQPLYVDPKGRGCFATGMSPDGLKLLISVDTPTTNLTDIFMVDLASPARPVRTAQPLFDTPADRVAGRLSPDGSLIAYSSSETGRSEVFLQPFPSMNRKLLVSTEGGGRPAWSADGSTLFYQNYGDLLSVSVSNAGELKVGKPELLMDHLPMSRYDPTPDGRRFVMCRNPDTPSPSTRIYVVLNAKSELAGK